MLNQSLGFFYIFSIFFPLDVIRSQLGVRKRVGGAGGGGLSSVGQCFVEIR